MSKPLASEFAEYAEALPDKHIPYTLNGSDLSGMDCQGLMEYILRKVGIYKNWSGSNAMWRDMRWTGTPEECVKQFGTVPPGAWLFIVEHDGAEKRYGYDDEMGNAQHVGVRTVSGAVHASASRKKVADSVFNNKTIPNGGWNRVGISPLLDYGLRVESGMTIQYSGQVLAAKTRLLRRGLEGEDVRAMQAALISAGYNLGAYGADGVFGSMTELAVRSYQQRHGLAVDGIAGPQTLHALGVGA